MTQPKCYSYIRFSSLEQRKGESQRRQTEAAEEWAKKHGQVLDDSLRPDLGLSAYSGAHRAKGALGKFLEKVREGLIVPGSILLVENLDRLSREQALDALGLFTDIIKADIKIVTLADGMEYTRETINANMMQLMMSLVILSRGHEESEMKSKRLSSAWGAKRNNLASSKLTARAPSWLRLSDDKTTFHLIPARAAIVIRIFEMKLQGIGGEKIAKILNQEKDTWNQESFKGRKGGNLPNGWRKSYIEKILNTRATIGEFQPYTTKDHKRIPAGNPIPDYFPSVISQALFHAVQDRLAMNKGKGGKNGAISNLFGHIAHCGYCGSPMAFLNKGPGNKGGKYLVCDKARRGAGCSRHSIQYPEFENLILSYCKGLTVSDLLPDAEKAKTEIERTQLSLSAIQGELADIEGRINNLMDSIASTADKRVRDHLEGGMTVFLDRAEKLREQEKSTQKELAQLARTSDNVQERLDSLNELLVFMDKATAEDVALVRLRLREKLRTMITQIQVSPVGARRMTPDHIEALTQAVLDVDPELKGTEELERLRSDLRGKINNKDFGQCHIYFHGGSIRTLLMRKKPTLAIDFDREGGEITHRWLEDGVEKFETTRAELPTPAL